jgi:TatD DNase family protein
MPTDCPIVDTHVHLDQYDTQIRHTLLAQATDVQFITVSMHLASCQSNLALSRRYPGRVYPAFGYHPEQELPAAHALQELLAWIKKYGRNMVAIGEVGLPYYLRTETELQGLPFEQQPYVDLLDKFIALGAQLGKPIVLHAIYEDAEIALTLLAKYQIQRAHFHWFKGSAATLEQMQRRGYMVSVTPDLLYEPEIERIVVSYPLELLLVETDGPWPFAGPFAGQTTTPAMLPLVIRRIAELKHVSPAHVQKQLWKNASDFYQI